MESLYNDSWQIPWTSNVMIDGDAYLDLIDQMRISIPEEIKQANRIQQERERIIAKAHEEAEHILALARDQATNLTNEHRVLQDARTQSESIVERARREADGFRDEAEEYAIEVLSELEAQLNTFLSTVRNGLADLVERRQKAQETPEQAAEEALEQQ